MFAHVHFPGTLRPGHTRLQNVFFFRVRGNPRRSMKKGTCSDLHAYASTPYAPFFARFMFFFLWIFFGLFICFYAHFMLRFSVFCSKFRLRIFVVFQHLFAFSAHFLLIFCSFFFSVYLFASQHVSPHYLLPLSLGIPGCISAQNIFRCLMLTIGPLRTFLFRMSCSGFISRQESLHVFSYSCTSAKYHMINEEKCICFDYQPRRAVKCAMTY